MITVKKVFEKDGKSVFQAYDKNILGEVIVENNKIVSEQMASQNLMIYRDFMLRSVVYLLSAEFDEVRIGYKDDYYKTLGFIEDEDGMKQRSDLIVFPSACGGH